MNRRSSLLALSLCVLSATLAAASTDSARASDLPAVTVSYQDLNLRQSADVRLLYARLQQAAARVCPAVPPYELARYAIYQRCINAALNQAVQAIERQHSGPPQTAANNNISGVAALVTPCARPTRL
jgi:UrcA family protein